MLWLYLSCHNALRLFKKSHNMQFRFVAVSVMPQRVVVVFPVNECFRSLSVTSISLFHLLHYNIKKCFRQCLTLFQASFCAKFLSVVLGFSLFRLSPATSFLLSSLIFGGIPNSFKISYKYILFIEA